MLFWIMTLLAVLAIQILLPLMVGGTGTMSERMNLALGPRDNLPPEPVVAQRARRALANLYETLPFFLAFGLLAIILHKDTPEALLGAEIYVIARVLYVPAYLSGVQVVRTVIWGVSVAGLVLMARAALG